MLTTANTPTASMAGNGIYVFHGGSRNIIRGNHVFGPTGTGISIQTGLAGGVMRDNIIANNIIEGCTVYGLILYRGVEADPVDDYSGNRVLGNVIRDVTGEFPGVNGLNFGAGIYVQGVDYTTIANNHIENTNRTLP